MNLFTFTLFSGMAILFIENTMVWGQSSPPTSLPPKLSSPSPDNSGANDLSLSENHQQDTKPISNSIEKKLLRLQAQQIQLQESQQRIQKDFQQLNQRLKVSTVAPADVISPPNKSIFTGLGPAPSKVYINDTPLSLGLSADLFHFIDDRSQDTPILNTWKVSPHLGYRFTPSIIFNSRITLENTGSEIHAPGSSQKGQTRIDFAYVDFLKTEMFNFRIGQQLLPLGLINQDPDGLSYFNVNPPDIETQIIPTVWSENGLAFWGSGENFHYQLGAFNSLVAKNFTADSFLREGRQSGQLAKAENIAGAARVDFISSLAILGVSGFIGSTSQEQSTIEDGTVTLYDIHLRSQWHFLSLNALFAQGEIRDPDSISIIAPGNPNIASKARGYYACLAIDLLAMLSSEHTPNIPLNKIPGVVMQNGNAYYHRPSLPLFIEYSEYDLNAEVPSGKTKDPLLNHRVTTLGINYRPINNLVFKLDYQFRRHQKIEEADIFSLGLSLFF